MNAITDNDLTLLYYGEHEDASLAATVAASAELSARYEALCRELAQMDACEPPRRGEDYGAEVWQRISPRLAESRPDPAGFRNTLLSTLGRPRFSLAGAFSLVLVATLAFVLGRQAGEPPTTPPPDANPSQLSALAGLDSGRLLTASVNGHLDQLNLVFTQFALQPESGAADAEHYTNLLVANRLYRQVAASRGEAQLATLLAELEPLLIELAHEAHKSSPATRDRMQTEIRERLLFRVRIMSRQLDRSTVST